MLQSKFHSAHTNALFQTEKPHITLHQLHQQKKLHFQLHARREYA